MKTFVVTGATGAMGWQATMDLLKQGHRVVLACRDTAKAAAMVQTLPQALRQGALVQCLELSSRKSIADFVALMAPLAPIQGLFNNAGVLMRHYAVNDEGLEMSFAVNYLGTVRLSMGLLPLLAEGATVVNTLSLSCYVSRPTLQFFQTDERHFRQVRSYADSKMALALFTQELARREASHLHVNGTDPGVVDSKLLHMDRWFDPLADRLFRPLCKTPQQGVQPALNALQSHANGMLYRGDKMIPMPRRWQDSVSAEALWRQTQPWL